MRITGKKVFDATRAIICLLLLPLAHCAAGLPARFTGPLTPRAGVCDAAGRAVLTLHDDFVAFAPQEGTLILSGKLQADGTISAHWSPANGPAHAAMGWTLTARVSPPSTINGTYVTPRCTYTVYLTAAGR